MKNAPQQRLILHFNIDKSIVMRDSLRFNNPDYCIREFFSEMIWGKKEFNKQGEPAFKVLHQELEFSSTNLPDPDMINYHYFVQEKYPLLTEEEEPNPEYRTVCNEEAMNNRSKLIYDVVEPTHPGNKFKKQFEEMRKRLRVPEKIQSDLGLKLDYKIDHQNLITKEEEKFEELGDDKPSDEKRKIKFRRIFKYSYHKIIVSFFQMMQVLRKARREYCVIFRFFGHSQEDIDEFFYEFNSFCEGNHPRYCGDYENIKVKFDGSKGTKNFRIQSESLDNVAISYRGRTEEQEAFIFETIERAESENEEIEEFYDDKINLIHRGYNAIYLKLMEKLSQFCSFVIADDYPHFQANNKNGKILLIDPYDYETQHIFFDTDLHRFPDKIEVIDIANKTRLDFNYCINKFLVNVDPKKAITDPNYFISMIERCELNRINEIRSVGMKEMPIRPIAHDFNIEAEIMKLPSDKYMEMTILPILNTALKLVDQMRPEDPIAFICSFMLKNKHTVKNLEEYLREFPYEEMDEKDENDGDDGNKTLLEQALDDLQN